MGIKYKVLRLFRVRDRRRFRLLIKFCALSLGLVAGFQVAMQMELDNFDSAAYWFLLVFTMALLEFVFGDAIADQSFPFETERKFEMMEKRLGVEATQTIYKRLRSTIDEFQGCDTSLISGTVHLLTELNATNDSKSRLGLVQLTDYVGPFGGNKGRVTLINQGIIGRCARTEQPESVDFANFDEYKLAMVREFGFTKRETDRHTTTARSYLAYPLKDVDRLVGVVYFFTTEPQVFPKAADNTKLDQLATEIVNYLMLAQLV